MTETYHPTNINDYKGEICAPKKGKRLLTIDALKAVYVALFHKPTHQHSRRVIAHVVTGDLLKRLQGWLGVASIQVNANPAGCANIVKLSPDEQKKKVSQVFSPGFRIRSDIDWIRI